MSGTMIKITAILVALIALGVGGYVLWERTQTEYLSETITRKATELGGGAHLLLPNLVEAEVTVIDRPHDPSEAMADDRFERIKRLRVFHVSTNSIGLRGPELAVPKDSFRVVCAGDSVTFGWGVSYEDSYPARLQQLFAARDLDVEVVNAGVPAMKPISLANWVTAQAGSWQPDLILVARRPDYGTPEPLKNLKDSVELIHRITRIPVALILPPVSTFDVMGTQNQADELAWIQANLVGIPVLDLTDVFQEEGANLSGVRLELGPDGIQRMFEMPGRQLLVESQGADRLAPEIIEAFEANPTLYEPLFFDGGHPTSEGFALFAEEVYGFVEKQGLVSQ